MHGNKSEELLEYGTESSQPRLDFDPLFLLSCAAQWRTCRDLNAGWELIHAVKSSNPQLRALALDLLECVAGYSRPVRVSSVASGHRVIEGQDDAFKWSYSPAESWR